MRNFHSLSGTLILSLFSALAHSQNAPIQDTATLQSTPSQVVHLSATASAQVTQDWLVMTLASQKEGSDAAVVQKQIQSSLAAALALVQSSAQKGMLDVSTGQMSVYPRYGRDGKSNGWAGVAELVLQGRDITRITEAAGRVQGMTVSQVQWQVSPELKRQVENRIQGQAVEQFQSRASALASSFGFANYSLREVRVSSQDSGHDIQPRMASVQMDSVAASPVPVQAGQSRVVVNVAGSIQLK
ncbi:MAG: SIMPL domain-containing protein [Limnohabitans sp.]|jgi:predicted secreted protein